MRHIDPVPPTLEIVFGVAVFQLLKLDKCIICAEVNPRPPAEVAWCELVVFQKLLVIELVVRKFSAISPPAMEPVPETKPVEYVFLIDIVSIEPINPATKSFPETLPEAYES